MSKLLIDTNIVIDLLSRRDEFYDKAAHLFSKADEGIGFANILFDIRKHKLYSHKAEVGQGGS